MMRVRSSSSCFRILSVAPRWTGGVPIRVIRIHRQTDSTFSPNSLCQVGTLSQGLNTLQRHFCHQFSTASSAMSKDQELINVIQDGSAVQVNFQNDQGEDEVSVFHASWLWLYQSDYMHPSSGQKTIASPASAIGWKIVKAAIVTDIGPSNANSDRSDPLIPPPPGCLHPLGTVYESHRPHHDHPPHVDSSQNNNKDNYWWLRIEWEHKDGENSTSGQGRRHFATTYHYWNWLEQCRYDHQALQRLSHHTAIHNNQNDNKLVLRSDSSLVEVDYHNLMNDDDACLDFLQSIVDHGAALIRNAPAGCTKVPNDDGGDDGDDMDDTNKKTVARVGVRLAGGLSHCVLYGSTFHVQSIANAHNIAYTSTPLPPHQDLAYYQSPPGLQLLHCVSNPQEGVRGGESTLLDAVAAATTLQQLAPPALFSTLTTCCATFVKQREEADIVYRCPHIQVDNDQVVVAVRWAPPFQGPVMVPPERITDYFSAYMAFECMLDNSIPSDYKISSSSSLSSSFRISTDLEKQLRDYAHEHTWEGRLKEGDILVFNNQRMLHGRRGFEMVSEEHERHFIGCYTNMEETLNRYRLLLRRRRQWHPTDSRHKYWQRISGNGSSGVL